jgi:hypothetical protein
MSTTDTARTTQRWVLGLTCAAALMVGYSPLATSVAALAAERHLDAELSRVR